MNAHDVMTRPAYTCRLDTTLDEASRFMERTPAARSSCLTAPADSRASSPTGISR